MNQCCFSKNEKGLANIIIEWYKLKLCVTNMISKKNFSVEIILKK